MSMDPQTMMQYMQMFGGGQQRQASPTGAANAMTPMLQALMLARLRKQNATQAPGMGAQNPLAGGTGSNVAPGAGDPSLGAAMSAGVS